MQPQIEKLFISFMRAIKKRQYSLKYVEMALLPLLLLLMMMMVTLMILMITLVESKPDS